MRGTVIKGIGGFYFVYTSQGIFRAKGRGLLKKEGDTILVGDEVEAEEPLPGDDDGIITEIYPRKNSFQRPPVSNIDRIIITMAAASPDPNLEVIDRLLVMAEYKGIEPIVCINKTDLRDDKKEIDKLYNIYSPIYKTVLTSCIDENTQGIENLQKEIAGYRVALAGPSGVGKSSITNLLIPDADMEVGEISKKTLRGRHTTRHVEIFPGWGGLLYDTPGFTSFELDDIDESELGDLFPEIREVSEECKFRNCLHLEEPSCAVRMALENNRISESRYKSYLSCIEEIRSKKKY